MPKVGSKHYSYTKAGVRAAKIEAKRTGKQISRKNKKGKQIMANKRIKGGQKLTQLSKKVKSAPPKQKPRPKYSRLDLGTGKKISNKLTEVYKRTRKK